MVTKIQSALETAINSMTGGLIDLVESLKAGLKSLVDRIETLASDVYNGIVEGVGALVNTVGQVVSSLTEKIQETVERVTGAVRAAYEEATEKIRTVLNNLINEISKRIGEFISIILAGVDYARDKALPFLQSVWFDTIEGTGERLSGLRKIWDGLVTGDYGEVRDGMNMIMSFEHEHDLSQALFAVGVIVSLAPAVTTSIARPAITMMIQELNSKFPIEVLPAETLVRARQRDLISTEYYRGEFAKLGYSPGNAQIAFEASRPLPSPGAVQEAYLRGFISEGEHDSLLRQHGYTDRDIALFKALYFIIPTPPDLIRMAVREAFTPEIAEKFGQYEDFPKTFADWAEKLGLSREWAERYWAAHWDLPSATQGFEMLHRGIIDENELKLLLRALDVMPYWRERLIKLSYVPYTRIDVRRMYQLGILSYNEVIKAYKELGYDDQKAKNLADFTVAYYTPEDQSELDQIKNLTRTVYTEAYKRGIISQDELRNSLLGLGYRDKDVELLIQLAVAERDVIEGRPEYLPRKDRITTIILDAYNRGIIQGNEVIQHLEWVGYTEQEAMNLVQETDYTYYVKLRGTFIEGVHENYVNRTYTRSEAQTIMSRIVPSPAELERLFNLWDVEREARTRKPTEAQFRAALGAGLIDIETYKEELKGLGYPDKYVELLAELAALRLGA